jgi:Rrf2 family protein
MFSKTCEYGIRALIFVAQKSRAGSRVGIKEIAKGTGAPEHFIAKIMQELSRKRLVQSVKGPNGGFFMNEDQLNTTLAEVVTTLDGHKIYTECLLGLKSCSENTPCPVHHQYKDIKSNLIKMIESNTIGEFNSKLDSGSYFLVN